MPGLQKKFLYRIVAAYTLIVTNLTEQRKTVKQSTICSLGRVLRGEGGTKKNNLPLLTQNKFRLSKLSLVYSPTQLNSRATRILLMGRLEPKVKTFFVQKMSVSFKHRAEHTYATWR